MDGLSSALLLLAIGGIVTFIVTARMAESKRRPRALDKQVVDLLKEQRRRKRRKLENQRQSYAEAKKDYESKYGPIDRRDDGGDGDGPSAG